jgi:sialate O-acetylesterase
LQSVPNTGMAVTTDIGDPCNIHPLNKQDVGRRLALWALAKTYGKDIEYSGPLYKKSSQQTTLSNQHKTKQICVMFDHAKAGLIAKGSSKQIIGFQIAGSDRKFFPAQATITPISLSSIGDPNKSAIDFCVEVYSPDVPDPVAVRYGWSDITTECNLYNKAGLPASPFRTDDWPDVTDNAK